MISFSHIFISYAYVFCSVDKKDEVFYVYYCSKFYPANFQKVKPSAVEIIDIDITKI